MTKQRKDRLDSLLKEVISDVILKEVKNPHVVGIITVTRVDITKDLRLARVYISVIGDDLQKKESIQALQSAAGFIAVQASKQVRVRFFPDLQFKLDDTVEKQMKIEELLHSISKEKETRVHKEEV